MPYSFRLLPVRWCCPTRHLTGRYKILQGGGEVQGSRKGRSVEISENSEGEGVLTCGCWFLTDERRSIYGVVTRDLGPVEGAVGGGSHHHHTQTAEVSTRLRTAQLQQMTDKCIRVNHRLLPWFRGSVPVGVAGEHHRGSRILSQKMAVLETQYPHPQTHAHTHTHLHTYV